MIVGKIIYEPGRGFQVKIHVRPDLGMQMAAALREVELPRRQIPARCEEAPLVSGGKRLYPRGDATRPIVITRDFFCSRYDKTLWARMDRDTA